MTSDTWASKPLSSWVDFVAARVEPETSSDIVYVGLEHIERDSGVLLGAGRLSEMRSTKTPFEAGDILYGKLRPYLNKVHLAAGPGACSTDIIVMRPRPGVSGRFVAHRLRMGDFVRYALENSTGVGRPRVSPKVVSEFSIELPGFDEQNALADVIDELLSDVDAGLMSVKLVAERRGYMRAAVLESAFRGNLLGLSKDEATGLPVGWSWACLGDASVASVQSGLTKNASRNGLPMKRPYLRVANVQADRLDLSEMKEIGVTAAEAQRLRLEKDDLLVVEGNGSREHIGRVAVWDGSVDDCVHQNHIIRARATAAMNPRFILYWLLSSRGRQSVLERAHTTSGLYTLSKRKVEALPVPVTDRKTQDRLVAEVDALLSIADKVERDMREVQTLGASLKNSVREAAFSGRLQEEPVQ